MKFVPRAFGRMTAFLVSLFLLGTVFQGSASAQTDSDEAAYRRFINRAGKVVLFGAWPTDTYDHMEFGGVSLKADGVDISVRLYGITTENRMEWTEAVVKIREGKIQSVAWGRYYAADGIPPGTPASILAQALGKLNDLYQRNLAQQAPHPDAQETVRPSASEIPRPSFNCAKAETPSEKLICSDVSLAAQEHEMADEYNSALQRVTQEQRSQLRSDHLVWFKDYARTCNAMVGEDDRKSCIRRYLREETERLQGLVR